MPKSGQRIQNFFTKIESVPDLDSLHRLGDNPPNGGLSTVFRLRRSNDCGFLSAQEPNMIQGGAQSVSVSELAGLWAAFAQGDAEARERLLGLYYSEFRRVARRILSNDSHRLRLQPTDLVHEAIVRILGGAGTAVSDQTHLLALAARVMRNTLVDEVRKHRAAKRGSVVTLWPDADGVPGSFDLEDFDLSLERLASIEPEGARIVELRFFAGMTLPEISVALGLSESTVQRRWRTARAWMIKELRDED